MRTLALIPLTALLAVTGCAHLERQARTQTPADKAGAALVGLEKCGGELTPQVREIVASAVQQEGSAAVHAAEYNYRALWDLADSGSGPVGRDEICAQLFRNGWLQ